MSLGSVIISFRIIKSGDPFHGRSGDMQKPDPNIGPIAVALDTDQRSSGVVSETDVVFQAAKLTKISY